MPRSISDPWEISKDQPVPYEPVEFETETFVPFFTAEEYVTYVNKNAPIKGIHQYDDYYTMPGHYVRAKIVDGKVMVKFVPMKVGKYWINLNNKVERSN